MTVIGRWERVRGMKLKPNCCIVCGSSPQATEEGVQEDAYFAQGVDVNWGDSVYLCSTCARIVGELRGMLDAEKAAELQNENERLLTDLEELQGEHRELQDKVERMLEGKKAVKEARKMTKKKVRA